MFLEDLIKLLAKKHVVIMGDVNINVNTSEDSEDFSAISPEAGGRIGYTSDEYEEEWEYLDDPVDAPPT